MAVCYFCFGGDEDFVQGEDGQLLAAFPSVVNVYVEVVSLEDKKTVYVKCLVAIEDLDVCGFSFGVFGATGEEATDDKFVDTLFIGVENCSSDVVYGVYGRVSLVVVATCSGCSEPPV